MEYFSLDLVFKKYREKGRERKREREKERKRGKETFNNYHSPVMLLTKNWGVREKIINFISFRRKNDKQPEHN